MNDRDNSRVIKPLIADIVKVASWMSGISVETILGPSRKRSVGRVRAAAIYVARQYSEGRYCDQRYSFTVIAKIFNRDHSSILHAFDSFDAYCTQTPGLREFADELKQNIEAIPGNVDEYIAKTKPQAKQGPAQKDERGAEHAAKQCYLQTAAERRKEHNWIKTGQWPRARGEMLARAEHDAIPEYAGRAKNNFRPIYREDMDGGHRAQARVAEGSRLLLEAILQERSRETRQR